MFYLTKKNQPSAVEKPKKVKRNPQSHLKPFNFFNVWNESLGRYHSNKTSLAELVHGTFYFLGFYKRYLEFLRISSPWPVLGIKGFKFLTE